MAGYGFKEHPNGHYWKIIESSTGKTYAKQEAVDLLNELEDMIADTEMELEELESENRRLKDKLNQIKTDPDIAYHYFTLAMYKKQGKG